MNGFSIFVGGVLPYLAILVFVVGMIYRVRVWYKTPQPGKMTLFPAKEGDTLKQVLAETFFFPSLFKGDKTLWGFSWLFHVMLALIFLGHFRVVTGILDTTLFSMGMTQDGVDTLSAVAGGGAGIVVLATGLLLLFRRITIIRVRQISGFPDFFALLLLLAIFITGDIMRFWNHIELEQTRIWARSLLTLSPVVPQHTMFLLHAMLAQFLFVYIPFSKVMHFGGIFFTQALIKRR